MSEDRKKAKLVPCWKCGGTVLSVHNGISFLTRDMVFWLRCECCGNWGSQGTEEKAIENWYKENSYD